MTAGSATSFTRISTTASTASRAVRCRHRDAIWAHHQVDAPATINGTVLVSVGTLERLRVRLGSAEPLPGLPAGKAGWRRSMTASLYIAAPSTRALRRRLATLPAPMRYWQRTTAQQHSRRRSKRLPRIRRFCRRRWRSGTASRHCTTRLKPQRPTRVHSRSRRVWSRMPRSDWDRDPPRKAPGIQTGAASAVTPPTSSEHFQKVLWIAVTRAARCRRRASPTSCSRLRARYQCGPWLPPANQPVSRSSSLMKKPR